MVSKDILFARDIILDNKKISAYENYFSRLYPFTTENLNGYIPGFDYCDKSVLTTGSSGDQIFNLINCGAKNITHLDINPFVKYYYNLKKAAILVLNKERFIDYFAKPKKRMFNFNKKVFDMCTYDKLMPYLDEDTRLFWQSLFSEFGSLRVRNKLFMDDELATGNHALKCNKYLQGSNYHKTREAIGDVSVIFKTKNLLDILNESTKYDYVLLSNILEYIFNMRILEEEEIQLHSRGYRNLVMRSCELVKEDGWLFLHYFWKYDNNLFFSIINNWLRDMKDIHNLSFKGICGDEDSVLVYHK